jgi:hypothetical protein
MNKIKIFKKIILHAKQALKKKQWSETDVYKVHKNFKIKKEK